MDLSSPLTALKGVGEKREQLYAKLGITNIGELLEHYPRGYLDLTGSLTIKDASDEHPCAVRATVTQKSPTRPIRKGLTVSKVRATDMERDLHITFFNAKYTVDALEIGEEYIFYGDFTKRLTGGEMNSPIVISPKESGFLPQYPLTEGLSSKMVSAQMKTALENCGHLIKETLSTAVLKKYDLCSKAEAIRNIHFPSGPADLEKAKRRLIFEEFLGFTLGMSLAKGKNRKAEGNAFEDMSTEEFAGSLGFELTGAQKRVIAECKKDMCSSVPMSRLIQGDVGSGKTAVAASCMYFAAKNGFQSAMMAPTEVLASQHKATLEKMFAPFGIKVGLLTGFMKAS
ncbi:MAG: DEAD/DEAH box helicase, partial [Oscillospiraceae bacterium]|nr:DEAD/DEAH box helicase [Oscillospiraceae bacterium]